MFWLEKDHDSRWLFGKNTLKLLFCECLKCSWSQYACVLFNWISSGIFYNHDGFTRGFMVWLPWLGLSLTWEGQGSEDKGDQEWKVGNAGSFGCSFPGPIDNLLAHLADPGHYTIFAVSQLSSLSLVTNFFYCTIMLMWEHNTNCSWLSLKCLVWTNYHPLKTPSLSLSLALVIMLGLICYAGFWKVSHNLSKGSRQGRLFLGWNF